MTPHLKIWEEKFATPRPRRLLALDGGGILGIMSLEILAEIERQLADKTGEGENFRLGDHFDYIGGTSAGAIIATGLSVGMSVAELIDFYVTAGPDMFTSRWLLARAKALYKADPLRETLARVLKGKDGQDRTLGADDLRCLLLVVARNATTDSPWPISNNPFAKYNDRTRDDCNLNILLWELVRASTAAPIYFPPEALELKEDQTFTFIDGGVTPYNNPAFLLYRMATLPQFRLNWPQGEDQMMLISVGTGSADKIDLDLDEDGRNLASNLACLPGVLMSGASVDQDINCRSIGRCVFGNEIDREIGDLIPRRGDPLTGDLVPVDKDFGRAFLYGRYNPDVSGKGLGDLGFSHLKPEHVQAMDKVEHMEKMREVGRAYAKKYVDLSPFHRFLKR